MNKPANCDIFCNVVDNYGDIGVCWRLARQLAHEHGIAVRLWVDDLASFRRLCPELDVQRAQQHCRGVEVRHWISPFPEVEPAQLVIEAFACELPQRYVEAMAAQASKPVWINLEYLSAEDWVEGCHKLPSPQPSLPLVKYFFFPGFTRKTGGLLVEQDLLAGRDAFQGGAAAPGAPSPALPRGERELWRELGVPERLPGELRVSLFCYENPALAELFTAWAEGAEPVCCLVPEGRVLPQVAAFFGAQQARVGDVFGQGSLRVHVLPFVEQERYDELLWACDINFVRGEDSCVRAQWAAKPFVWHIYPQHDGVHMQKLRALLALYCGGLPPPVAQAVNAMWEAWNAAGDLGRAWNDFRAHRSMLREHAHAWAQHLSGNSLALNLLDFFREIDRMRGLQN